MEEQLASNSDVNHKFVIMSHIYETARIKSEAYSNWKEDAN